jgi:hypothetical protein
MRLRVEILITACKLMSVKEHLYLLLLIFKQEKLCSQIYIDPNTENKSRFKADFLSWRAAICPPLVYSSTHKCENI